MPTVNTKARYRTWPQVPTISHPYSPSPQDLSVLFYDLLTNLSMNDFQEHLHQKFAWISYFPHPTICWAYGIFLQFITQHYYMTWTNHKFAKQNKIKYYTLDPRYDTWYWKQNSAIARCMVIEFWNNAAFIND